MSITLSKHLPADQRRAVTVDTVVRLAAQRNPIEITTAAIAERMGVTQGALLRHFPTKDAILQAVMVWVADELLGRIDAAAASAASPLHALEAMFLAHAAFVVEHPGVPRILFGELQRPDDSDAKRAVQGLLGRYRMRLAERIAQAQTAGDLPVSLDADAAVTLLIGTLQGLVMQSMLAGDVGRIRRDAPRVFAIYLCGIRSAR